METDTSCPLWQLSFPPTLEPIPKVIVMVGYWDSGCVTAPEVGLLQVMQKTATPLRSCLETSCPLFLKQQKNRHQGHSGKVPSTSSWIG